MITFIINANTYRVDPADVDTINAISPQDRKELVDLLCAIQQHDKQSKIKAQALLKQVNQSSQITDKATTKPVDHAQPAPERLGRGDVDALMAKLAMEETSQQKTGLSKSGIYKFFGGVALLIFILVLIF